MQKGIKKTFDRVDCIIRADKIVPWVWEFIKFKYPRQYKQMQAAIKLYGAKKVKIGFTKHLKPICESFSLR